jgi:hypothetical protein
MNEQDFTYSADLLLTPAGVELFAGMYSNVTHEVSIVQPGVWKHTFTPVVATSTPTHWTTLQLKPDHVHKRDPRAIRLRKIKRRQKRAAYRRKKRGLS